MALLFQANGNLEPGIHELSIEDLKIQFGFTKKRRDLIDGLLLALRHLKDCNCSAVYIDGSFASNIDDPNDFDVCYDPTNMDWSKMFNNYPVFLDFANRRENQKKKYKGEFFSATALAAPPRYLFIDFFQKDKNDSSPKGIIKINLNNM